MWFIIGKLALDVGQISVHLIRCLPSIPTVFQIHSAGRDMKYM